MQSILKVINSIVHKSRAFDIFVTIAVLVILVINIVIFINRNNDKDYSISIPEIASIYTSENERINEYLNKLDEKQKTGEIFWIGIDGKVLSDNDHQFLKENNIGGIVLLGSNIENEEQLKKLTSDLRNNVDPDLFIAIDQEGGLVTRIKWDPYADVSFREIGDTGDLEYAYKVAYERSKMLLDLGINVILGPVADIAYTEDSFMYDRSFGSDPETVAKFVEVTVKAQKDAGIITVLKHFPGHGKTSVDSHNDLPVINLTKEELIKTDFIPFKRGIEAGADGVMLAHILNPSINPTTPSSIDKQYLDILQKDLGFKGFIVTDDLKMTGKIKGGIGWGINLDIESTDKVLERINQVSIDETFLKQIVELKLQ